MRRIAGAILIDGRQTADTLQCCHCNAHWVVQPGSGKRRGYCMGCNKPTCGHPNCDPCIPFELKLEMHERTGGRSAL